MIGADQYSRGCRNGRQLTMVALIDQLEAAGLGKDAEEGD
jgi:hypothetical protein